MSKEIPFEKSFASHEKAKYWSDKNLLKPSEVMKGSHKKYIFDCDCGHEIEISIKNVNKGKWCSFCCNPPKKLCDNKDCKLCFEKSFASHEELYNTDNKALFDNIIDKIIFTSKTCLSLRSWQKLIKKNDVISIDERIQATHNGYYSITAQMALDDD